MAHMATVLVTRQTQGDSLEQLQQLHQVEVWAEDRPIPRQTLLQKVATVQGLYVSHLDKIDQELLDAAPHLKVISTYGVGIEHIDVAACTERGIAVGHTPHVVSEATADLAMAILLALSRRIPEAQQFVREDRWNVWSPHTLVGTDVFGKTMGFLGLGRIGQAIARRAKGFGMPLLYHTRTPNPQAEQELGARHCSWPDLLTQSDVLMVIAPLTPQTYQMVNAEALAMMKPTTLLVNVARGGLVDTEALVQALSNGTLAGAALDVTDPEPIGAEHPLLHLSNCLVVPHIGTATLETRSAITQMAVENLLLGLEGKPLRHPANPEVRPRT